MLTGITYGKMVSKRLKQKNNGMQSNCASKFYYVVVHSYLEVCTKLLNFSSGHAPQQCFFTELPLQYFPNIEILAYLMVWNTSLKLKFFKFELFAIHCRTCLRHGGFILQWAFHVCVYFLSSLSDKE